MAGDDDKHEAEWRRLQAEMEAAFHDQRRKLFEEHPELKPESEGSSSPFASFKRFVDSNFNTLTQGFKNFPSNVSEIKSRMQREQERQQAEEQDISEAWTGSSNSPDHIQMEVLRSSGGEKDEAHAATLMLLTEAFRRNANVPAEKIEALYEDRESVLGELDRLVNPMLALGGAWFYMPETGDRLPVGKDKWQWLAPSPRWLSVDWFKRSPYSPVRLERHADLGMEGSKWREAFEDLMNASLDKPMESHEKVGMREPHGKPQSTHWGPGLEWMLSLQCRGILPPLLPRFFNDSQGKRTLRAMPHHILSQVSRNLPWSSEHSLNWYSNLDRDFSDLMSEVATKSTADWEADPLVSFPQTEQDLYDSSHIYPQAQATGGKLQVLLPPEQTREQDWAEADIALWEAIDSRNVASAARIMSSWYKQHGDIMELVNNPLNALSSAWSSEPHWGSFSVLVEAVRRSDIPEHHYLKQQVNSPAFRAMEQVDQETGYERSLRQALMEEGDELAGKALPWPLCSIEELDHKLDRLAEEYQSISESTGEQTEANPALSDYQAQLAMLEAQNRKRLEMARQEQEGLQHVGEESGEVSHPKKPDVLSALTTTQTTRLPDGTVTTKVVLKKRFSDGREETTERVHTSNEKSEQPDHRVEESPKKKGWFWS